jgi:hemolysin (fragment)
LSLYYCLEETYEKDTKFVYNDVKNITKESVELHNFYRSGLKSYGINAGATVGYV